MSQTPPIACNLDALDRAEQARRAELARSVVGRARRAVETADGFALQIEDVPALIGDALEWVRLERRCCPFLRFELAFDTDAGPVWLRLGGGPGVKDFLAASGLAASAAAREACGCC